MLSPCVGWGKRSRVVAADGKHWCAVFCVGGAPASCLPWNSAVENGNFEVSSLQWRQHCVSYMHSLEAAMDAYLWLFFHGILYPSQLPKHVGDKGSAKEGQGRLYDSVLFREIARFLESSILSGPAKDLVVTVDAHHRAASNVELYQNAAVQARCSCLIKLFQLCGFLLDRHPSALLESARIPLNALVK